MWDWRILWSGQSCRFSSLSFSHGQWHSCPTCNQMSWLKWSSRIPVSVQWSTSWNSQVSSVPLLNLSHRFDEDTVPSFRYKFTQPVPNHWIRERTVQAVSLRCIDWCEWVVEELGWNWKTLFSSCPVCLWTDSWEQIWIRFKWRD